VFESRRARFAKLLVDAVAACARVPGLAAASPDSPPETQSGLAGGLVLGVRPGR
jgi:hypothetical protein